MIAALHAATRGATVTVLERAPVFGGTTAISGGGQWLPGNPLAKAVGLEDSPAEVETYLDHCTLGLVAKPTLLSFIENAPNYYEFLATKVPVEIEATEIPDYYRGLPGSKDGGRQIAIGLYDSNRLGEYKELLRQGPWPGAVGPYRSSEEEAGEKGKQKLSRKEMYALGRERMEKGIAARGRALVGSLMEASLKHGVVLHNNTRARALIIDNGRVVGVHAEREGKDETFAATKGVVLASGGFEWNRKLWNGLVGVPLDGPMSPPWNEGDGLYMAMTAGARLGNTNQVWWSPGGPCVPGHEYDGKPRPHGISLRTVTGSITVNRRGRRFMNENMPYNDAGRPITHFDWGSYTFVNYPAYSIIDRASFEKASIHARDYSDSTPTYGLVEADTLRELAAKIDVDADGLEQQVQEWNSDTERGVDTQFHRGEREYDLTRGYWEGARADTTSGLTNPLLRPICDGPYYAIQLYPNCFGTKGGPVIDENAQVRGFDDRPIPGLFAAGNVTAGVFGHAYPGGGGTLGAALTFGWIAGRSVST
jgi:succinate dehydrogenase/fumarate reductase flavoprotein subunit